MSKIINPFHPDYRSGIVVKETKVMLKLDKQINRFNRESIADQPDIPKAKLYRLLKRTL